MLPARLFRASARTALVHIWRQPRVHATSVSWTLGYVRSIRSARKAQTSISWQTAEQAEGILREHEGSSVPNGGTSAISRHYYNIVGANARCEDAAAYATIDGRRYYAVFDGHAGRLLSYQLANILIPRVASELRDGRCESDEDTSAAIKRAFVELDDEIVRKPIKLLEAEHSSPGGVGSRSPDAHKDLLLAWELATQGSCALLLVVDEARKRLHVAVTGDSRAVMGTRDPSEPQGHWAARVLTEDQTSANPKEARRLQAEHPAEEAGALVKDGRTLDLGMSRAFGDAWFKWSADEIRATARALFARDAQPYPDCKTPPYITARPEVTSLALPSAGGFVVLASDGLWEWLSGADAVGLVGGFLDGAPHARRVDMAPHPPDAYLPPPFPGGHGRGWDLKDDNAATHLIRNAVAGESMPALQMQYSLPASMARNYRDDMTAVVVVFGDALREAAKGDDIQG